MGTKKKEETKDAAKEASDKFLAPIVKGLDGNYGARTLLTELLSKRAGKPISRNRLTRWLRREATKREIPLLGIGLLLREVFDKNKIAICQPQKLKYWNRRPGGAAKEKPTTNKRKRTTK